MADMSSVSGDEPEKEPSIQERLAKIARRQASLLAERAALRVFPLIFSAWGDKGGRAFILAHWRLLVLLRISALSPHIDSRAQLNAARDAVWDAARDAARNAGTAARAAAWGAGNAAGNAGDAAWNAGATARSAARAAAGDAARNTAGDAFEMDLFTVERGGDLNTAALWPEDVRGKDWQGQDVPPWIHEPLDRFIRRSTGTPWALIPDWYRGVLTQKPFFSEETSRILVEAPEEFWSRDADDVMADIQAIHEGREPTHSSIETTVSTADEPTENDLLREDDIQDPRRVSSDQPTTDDILGRRYFAVGLTQLIHQVYKNAMEKSPDDYDGFAVHLHAPWGAGKSSVLKLMKEEMEKGDAQAGMPPFIVVEFNAWDHEHRKPPWWPLIETTKNTCLDALSTLPVNKKPGKPARWPWLDRQLNRHFRSPRARLEHAWLWWKMRADGAPLIITLSLVLLIIPLIFALPENQISGILKTISGIAGAAAIFVTVSQSLIFGSPDAANRYVDLKRDPLKIFKRNFDNLLCETVSLSKESRPLNPQTGAPDPFPLCIMIDDLDRCSAHYVVNLLEGIQTAFRHRHVVYIVAADRDWVRSAFQQRYKAFMPDVASEERPLGHLFLEKIFQLSTPLPSISAEKRREYWQYLLGTEDAPDTAPLTSTPTTPAIDPFEDQPVTTPIPDDPFDSDDAPDMALGSSASTEEEKVKATRIIVGQSLEESKIVHFLRGHHEIMPPNPRFMKRVLNAYQMRRVIRALEGGAAFSVSKDTLVRWTVLEQFYPLLASRLEKQPSLVEVVRTGDWDEDTYKELAPYKDDPQLQILLGKGDDEHDIDAQVIANLTHQSLRDQPAP